MISTPCYRCQKDAYRLGIKKIYYSTGDEQVFGVYKPSEGFHRKKLYSDFYDRVPSGLPKRVCMGKNVRKKKRK